MRNAIAILVFVAAIAPSVARAELRLARVFTDDMLLQRDRPVRVWGWADVGEKVSVTLAGNTVSATADAAGAWLAELPALAAGENLELTAAGKGATVTLKNLIMGDLWVCSGQSNMEWQLGASQGGAEDVKAADLPKLRRIKMSHVTSAYPEDEAPVSGPWQVSSPKTAGSFTAAGFYFAREIIRETGVPVGLIDVNRSNTQIEPWTPVAALEMLPWTAKIAEERKKAAAYWLATSLPEALARMEQWLATTREVAAKGGRIRPPPAIPPHPGSAGWGAIYNAMIHPLVRMPVKGVIWYQGESNASEAASYCDKMTVLVGGWRRAWGQGDFPFYYVQIANYQQPNNNPEGGDGWARLREAQLKSLRLPNTGMVVTIDIGEAGEIHPKNKYDVGLRLSRWALARDYGRNALPVSGPLFREMKVEGGKARLFFDHAGKGLMAGKKSGRAPVEEDREGKLPRFAVAGADKKWVWADAVIEGETVVVSASGVSAIVAVRYAFSQNPDGANLYNRDGLPASPFRTDNW